MIMTKKKYTKPTMEIMEMGSTQHLLAGSGEEPSNPYWDPPEDKPGCDTPWWCP
jgi:hypothetical protein